MQLHHLSCRDSIGYIMHYITGNYVCNAKLTEKLWLTFFVLFSATLASLRAMSSHNLSWGERGREGVGERREGEREEGRERREGGGRRGERGGGEERERGATKQVHE